MNSVAMKFCDVETNTVIPQFQIGIITSRLLEAGQISLRAQRVWNTVIFDLKANGGEKKAALEESDKILPGGKTKLFHQCLVTMRIVGPPLILTGLNDREIAQQYKEFQMAMHDAILRLAPGLEGLICDLFTPSTQASRLGRPASITYVRFLSYLATTVVTLNGQLNMTKIHQYELKATFYLEVEGRSFRGAKDPLNNAGHLR